MSGPRTHALSEVGGGDDRYLDSTLPSAAALAYLLRALFDAEVVRGRPRDPDVARWARSTRVQIIGLLPREEVDRVIAEAEALRTGG